MRKEIIILPNEWSIEEGQNLLVTKVWSDKFRYAEVEVSEEKHFFFESRGMKFRLSVSNSGFTLWHDNEGQWLLDASAFNYNHHITFGNNAVLRGLSVQPRLEGVNVGFEIMPKSIIEAEDHRTHRDPNVCPAVIDGVHDWRREEFVEICFHCKEKRKKKKR